MGKTLVIRGADFSEVAIGHVDIPRELSAVAKAWIAASGNTGLTDAQKFAIDDFITAIGVGIDNSVYSKIDRLWLPMLSADKAHSLIDYKNDYANAIESMTENSKNSFDSYAGFENHGLKISTAPEGTASMIVVDNSYVFNSQDYSLFQFNTTEYGTRGSGSLVLSGIGDKTNAYKRFGQTLTTTALSNKFLSNTALNSDNVNGFRLPHLRGGSSNSESLKILVSDGTLSTQTAVASENLTGIAILRGAAAYCNAGTTASYGAYIVGKAMTDEQVSTLRTAIDALFAAINV